jgi:hypothetical protein
MHGETSDEYIFVRKSEGIKTFRTTKDNIKTDVKIGPESLDFLRLTIRSSGGILKTRFPKLWGIC